MRAAEPREQSLHELVRFVGLSSLLQPLLSFGISVSIARALGPEGRGAYGVLVTTLAVLPALVGVGLEYSVRHWAARGQVDPRSLLKTATLIAAILGPLAAGVALLSAGLRYPDWLIPRALGPVGVAALAVALLLIVLRGFWSNYLAGLERYGYGTWGTNLALLLQLTLLLALGVAGRLSLDAAMLALGLQLAFSFLLFLALAGRELRGALRAPALPRVQLRRMARYGWLQYLSILLTQTNLRLNVFLLAALGGLYETGLYTAVLGPAHLLGLLAGPLSLVLASRTARRSADPAFPQRVAAALRLVVMITLVAALPAAALAPAFLPWAFGARFAAAVAPFWLLLPGVIALALVRVISQYLAGASRPEWNTGIACVGAALTVGLNLLLIPGYGARGAALATSCAHLGASLAAVVAFLRVSGLGLRELLAFQASDWAPLGRVVGIAGTRRATP